MFPFLLALLAVAPPPAVHAAQIQSSPVLVRIAPHKGTRRLSCSLDGARARSCKKRSRFRFGPGRHTIAVRAVYADGRTSRPRVVAVVVPAPAPPAVHVGGAPVGIAAVGNAVWVSGGTSGDVSRIDAASRTVTEVVHVGGDLGGIGAAPGAVWVSDFGGGSVARIDPASGSVTARIPLGGQPTGVAVADDGSAWVGNLAGFVSRIDTKTNSIDATIELPSGASMPLVARGLVWVGLQDGSVVSVDPATNKLTGGAIAVDQDVDALADSPGGIWVSTFVGSVALLDPTARRVAVKRKLPGRGSGIAVAGGSVWASDYDGALVIRLDPATGALLGAVKSGRQPRESAVAGGYLWVLDQADAAVTPIPLPAASLR